MSAPAGYKQTEVGVIPEDWGTAPLGSLTVMMTNGFVGTATSHYANNDNGILYIQGYNVEENSFDFHGIKYVTEDFHRAHMKSCLRSGDLLTVQTGDVGLTTIVPESLAGSNCHALIISRFDQTNVSPAFISFYLNSKPGRSRLRLIETGTTMKHLNVGDVLQFLVTLPPTKAEQEAIAGALSDADGLIESLVQLIAKKRLLKQGAMQQLLTGKKRLPGFNGEWEVKRLGDVVNINKGTLITEKTAKHGPVPVIAGGKKPAYFHNSANRTGKTITVSGSGANAGYVGYYDVPIFASDCSTIGEGGNYTIEFVYFLLLMNQEEIYKAQTGGAQPHIHPNDLRPLEFAFPKTTAEQTAIAAVLSDMDREIEALETKLGKARQLKAGMMHNLLTGRIRLI